MVYAKSSSGRTIWTIGGRISDVWEANNKGQTCCHTVVTLQGYSIHVS